jgi:hypothetical protein
MKNRCTRNTACLVFAAISCFGLACGVTSRYRLDLFVASEGVQKKVEVEQTEYVHSAILGDPYLDYKYNPGDGNVAVITVGTRWGALETERFRLLGFDEYWRCRLYLELPEPVRSGELPLEGKSFLQVMGRYDVSPEEKIFLPSAGSWIIDSVNSSSVFFSINGKYLNQDSQPLEFTGQFKVKRSD